MARQREPRQSKSLPPGKKETDDDVIIGEFVDRQLVSPQTIEKFAERDRDHEDFERFLGTVNNFQARQLELNRQHALLHPDAIEGRKSQNFRRLQYVALMALLPFILVALLYVTLPVATVLGIIGILIVSGVLVNGRDREMDLNGFIRMIQSITGGKEK